MSSLRDIEYEAYTCHSGGRFHGGSGGRFSGRSGGTKSDTLIHVTRRVGEADMRRSAFLSPELYAGEHKSMITDEIVAHGFYRRFVKTYRKGQDGVKRLGGVDMVGFIHANRWESFEVMVSKIGKDMIPDKCERPFEAGTPGAATIRNLVYDCSMFDKELWQILRLMYENFTSELYVMELGDLINRRGGWNALIVAYWVFTLFSPFANDETYKKECSGILREVWTASTRQWSPYSTRGFFNPDKIPEKTELPTPQSVLDQLNKPLEWYSRLPECYKTLTTLPPKPLTDIEEREEKSGFCDEFTPEERAKARELLTNPGLWTSHEKWVMDTQWQASHCWWCEPDDNGYNERSRVECEIEIEIPFLKCRGCNWKPKYDPRRERKYETPYERRRREKKEKEKEWPKLN